MTSHDLDAWAVAIWDTDTADVWHKDLLRSSRLLEQSAPIVPMSIPFLTLPREIRDMIYRYLLSTEYTKQVYREAFVVSTLRSIDAVRLIQCLGLDVRRI